MRSIDHARQAEDLLGWLDRVLGGAPAPAAGADPLVVAVKALAHATLADVLGQHIPPDQDEQPEWRMLRYGDRPDTNNDNTDGG